MWVSLPQQINPQTTAVGIGQTRRRSRHQDIFTHQLHRQLRTISERLNALECDSFLFPHACEAIFSEVMTLGRPARRAFIYLPGFRADGRAAAALASELSARGADGAHFLCYSGGVNEQGEPLISAGSYALPALMDLVYWVRAFLCIEEVVVLAASHGMIAAVEACELGVGIDALVLDCPLHKPVNLLRYLAEQNAQEYSEFEAFVQSKGVVFVTLSWPFHKGSRFYAWPRLRCLSIFVGGWLLWSTLSIKDPMH